MRRWIKKITNNRPNPCRVTEQELRLIKMRQGMA
jgi:hypothetical protein